MRRYLVLANHRIHRTFRVPIPAVTIARAAV